ncbi:MAG TPA: L-seryl-tRNA(Sec) selenium transferase [Candidatus Krumholzibacteria bacterium]|nr:L-seryl-tRNA(Sec) selenium transferase [Candidatus Krumholzibacteria bacterium]HPD72752.1 L-seryl-tRNA(Sec) selenium transferase [Candidatus Krumholzibacteria bacterium]HRY40316.1 L-seryl-tRNA(Sec) selenium transferase [Candidatus Krumholzibacteria bacterium]
MSDPLLRELPPVGALLDHPEIAALARGRRRIWVTRVVQQAVEDLRRDLARGDQPRPAGRPELEAAARARIRAAIARLLAPASRRVINATGVVVHTNLGRSRWPARAVEWAAAAAAGNSDLEYVLETGQRGHRGRQVEAKVALLAGSEDALVVNNNAAAVWLAVRHLSRGGRVVLSRGEIVAIGGSFRLDEILGETHCELVEVGTTNRTTLADYEAALTGGATVLKVHRSNFKVTGFTAEVGLADLAALCRRRGARLVYDAGSGALYPFADLGLPPEPTLDQDLAAGADLVTCSGDKLLGGCQAGLVLGARDEIAALRRHPMRRAFRVDKTTLAALDAVLTLYLEAEDIPEVPTLEHLARPLGDLEAAAAALAAELQPEAPPGWSARTAAATATVGGGSFSEVEVPTRLLLWTGPREELEAVHQYLRTGEPALVGRISQDGLGVDLRTVAPAEYPLVGSALRGAWRRLRGERRGSET